MKAILKDNTLKQLTLFITKIRQEIDNV